MGTLRFFEEVVSFKIRRTFGFADYKSGRLYIGRIFSYLRLDFYPSESPAKIASKTVFGW